ncbi:hypothetical protein SmJEL517_g01009 [Synchytrium microbalum]|uniref:Uncharacterized protein n=1 Tax=Synchytrium microbalum TaxID=1806994 RepID=A0A507C5V5_9FUNG|nr:uncharacterized protein SmJEL517_g01009 [Synchytrium microbalum]TPX36970.1 hypothetical protein SmJEL517_g01009 [Synchytrium microbalum]
MEVASGLNWLFLLNNQVILSSSILRSTIIADLSTATMVDSEMMELKPSSFTVDNDSSMEEPQRYDGGPADNRTGTTLNALSKRKSASTVIEEKNVIVHSEGSRSSTAPAATFQVGESVALNDYETTDTANSSDTTEAPTVGFLVGDD